MSVRHKGYAEIIECHGYVGRPNVVSGYSTDAWVIALKFQTTSLYLKRAHICGGVKRQGYIFVLLGKSRCRRNETQHNGIQKYALNCANQSTFHTAKLKKNS